MEGKTVLNQLENWIIKFELQNGTPTMYEIKSQIDMFKEKEKEAIIEAWNESEEHKHLREINRIIKNKEDRYTCFRDAEHYYNTKYNNK